MHVGLLEVWFTVSQFLWNSGCNFKTKLFTRDFEFSETQYKLAADVRCIYKHGCLCVYFSLNVLVASRHWYKIFMTRFLWLTKNKCTKYFYLSVVSYLLFQPPVCFFRRTCPSLDFSYQHVDLAAVCISSLALCLSSALFVRFPAIKYLLHLFEYSIMRRKEPTLVISQSYMQMYIKQDTWCTKLSSLANVHAGKVSKH